MNLHEIAQWHLDRGFVVVPTHGKRALMKWGRESRQYLTPGKEAAPYFSREYRCFNRITSEDETLTPNGIGAILEPMNAVVLDLDSKEAIEWARWWARREPEFKQAFRVKSPRDGGGLHLWFRQREGRNRLRQLHGFHDKVDLKADGSLVVLPGSLHKTGRRYTWDIRPKHVHDLPEAPTFLYDCQDKKDEEKAQWDGNIGNFHGMAGTVFAQLVEVFSGNEQKAHIRCPNWQNHSGRDVSGTVLYPANNLGGLGKIHCEHSSCHGLGCRDYKVMIGERECNDAEREIKSLDSNR